MGNPVYSGGAGIGTGVPHVKIIGRIRPLPGNNFQYFLVEVTSHKAYGYQRGERFHASYANLWDRHHTTQGPRHVWIGKEWHATAVDAPWYHQFVDYKRRVSYEKE